MDMTPRNSPRSKIIQPASARRMINKRTAGVASLALTFALLAPLHSMSAHAATTVPVLPSTSAKLSALDAPEAVNDFNTLATELQEKFPASFASAWYDARTEGGTIMFAAGVPDGAHDRANRYPNVKLEGGVGYTAQGMDQYIVDVLNLMDHQIGPDGGSVVVLADPESRAFSVTVGPATAKSPIPHDPSGLLQKYSKENPPPGEFSLEASVLAEPLVDFEISYDGGRSLGPGCTGSFPIKQNGTDRLGVLTAGHCPGTGAYSNILNAFNAVQPYSVFTEAAVQGGDFRWNHSKWMLTGYTFTGSNNGNPIQRREFATGAIAAFGAQVCGYGVVTGYKCSFVKAYSVGAQVTLSNADGGGKRQVAPLRCTKEHITSDGDSGGPWFVNTTAYGVHSGHYKWSRDGETGNGSCWSNVTFATQKLGVSLWVG